jgi:hypothetical protein
MRWQDEVRAANFARRDEVRFGSVPQETDSLPSKLETTKGFGSVQHEIE